jgi:hypothetical protein
VDVRPKVKWVSINPLFLNSINIPKTILKLTFLECLGFGF